MLPTPVVVVNSLLLVEQPHHYLLQKRPCSLSLSLSLSLSEKSRLLHIPLKVYSLLPHFLLFAVCSKIHTLTAHTASNMFTMFTTVSACLLLMRLLLVMLLRFISKKNKKDDALWGVCGYCYSDVAEDKETRVTVSGFCVFLVGCLVSWKSCGQKNMTLSSTKVEYVEISALCAEVLFVRMILDFLGKKINYPL